MSTAVADIRTGLVTNLRTKFAEEDYQITGYVLSAPSPTAFFDIEFAEGGIEYDLSAHRGYDRWWFTVRVCVARTSDIGSQRTMDYFIDSAGEMSVKQALESDTTLGGIVDALHVTHATGPKVIGVPSQPANVFLGCEWTVEILARGA